MKKLLYLLVLFTSLMALEIDPKMFDEKEGSAYLSALEKRILEDKTHKLRSEKILIEELYYLQRIKGGLSQVISIEKFNVNTLKKQEITTQNLLIFLKKMMQFHSILEENKKLVLELQNKLSFSKKQIDNFTKEEKEKALLYQLQFAYYKVQKSKLEKKGLLLDKELALAINDFNTSFENLKKSNIQDITSKIVLYEENLKKLEQQRIEQLIEQEKARLAEDKTSQLKSEKRLIELDKLIGLAVGKLLDTYIETSILYLSINDHQKYMLTLEKMDNHLSREYKLDYNLYTQLNEYIKVMAKEKFGSTKVILATSTSEVKNAFAEVNKKIQSPLFVFNEQIVTFTSLLKAILVIIIGFVCGYIYKKWLLKFSRNWTNISDMSLKISTNVGFYLIIFITLLVALGSLGIDMSSISLIAGALSIGIGFGLQTVVSNFIAGIILMFERTIRIGDVIEINELLKGTVTDIRIRSTTIKTFDNIDIVIPNSSFIQNNVINWTLEDSSRRLHVPFSTAYGTKVEEVKDAVLTELKQCDLTYIRNDENKVPEVRMELMNSSSVDFELLVWVKTNDRVKPNALRSDFLILIYNALQKHNIEIPFPQLDVHFKDKKKDE